MSYKGEPLSASRIEVQIQEEDKILSAFVSQKADHLSHRHGNIFHDYIAESSCAASQHMHYMMVYLVGMQASQANSLRFPRSHAHAWLVVNSKQTSCLCVWARFNGMFQRVNRREGFQAVYRAANQQDIDNFVKFIGPAMAYPPSVSTPGYGPPGLPNGNLPHHIAPDLAHMQPPSTGTQTFHQGPGERPDMRGNLQQQPCQVQSNSDHDHTLPRSNIVPFRKPFSPGNRNQPGGITGYFVDAEVGQDMRPILLFDLNGTLTSHTFARRSAGRSLMRPGIQHLRRLQVGALSTGSCSNSTFLSRTCLHKVLLSLCM